MLFAKALSARLAFIFSQWESALLKKQKATAHKSAFFTKEGGENIGST